MSSRDGATTAGKKKWHLFWAGKNREIDENADPKDQMYMAVEHAKEEHLGLTQAASDVIGSQKTMEMQLHRMIDEYEHLQKEVKAALQLQAKATDPAKKVRYGQQAKDLHGQMKQMEADIESQKQSVLAATTAAQQAQQSVDTNSRAMQKALREQHELLAMNAQAVTQERMNGAMTTLTGSIGDGINPTFSEVREKIEARMGTAMGAAQLQGASTQTTLAEIEAASLDMDADTELDAMRAEMGLPVTTPMPEIAAAQPDAVVPSESS